jgi:hypothetical protein
MAISMRVSALNIVVFPDFFSPISPIFMGAPVQEAVYSTLKGKRQQPYRVFDDLPYAVKRGRKTMTVIRFPP